MSSNDINTYHCIIAQNVSAMIMDKVCTKDKKTLQDIGISKEIIDFMISFDISQYNAIVAAVEKSVFYGIDPAKFNNSIINSKKNLDNNEMLIKFIEAGASFELCRHFFSWHTNRKHTELREQLQVQCACLGKDSLRDKRASYQFFYRVSQTARGHRISAIDFYQYHLKSGFDINRIWRYFKSYCEDAE